MLRQADETSCYVRYALLQFHKRSDGTVSIRRYVRLYVQVYVCTLEALADRSRSDDQIEHQVWQALLNN